MSYFKEVKVTQDVQEDLNNSSSDNLTAGGTFDGTATSTLGIVGIQVSLKTDQNCDVNVMQSPDGINWDIIDHFHYYTIENFGKTIQAINSYVKVVVENKNTISPTTYFRLQTVLCPMVEAVPRSLDEDGNFKTSICKTQDQFNFISLNTPTGENRVIQPVRLVGATFDGNTLDSNFWTSTIANNGSISQGDAQIVLSTNITSQNGSAKLTSFRRARYVSGSGLCWRSNIQLSAGEVNNKRRWGVGYGTSMPTITDGAWFELDGNTFSVVISKNNTPQTISSGSFNGKHGSTYSPNLFNNTYEIYWNNSRVFFVINDVILHTYIASSETWSSTMELYIYLDNINSNNLQTNNTLTCRNSSIRKLGTLITQPSSKYQSGITAGIVLKYGAGNIHEIIVSGVTNTSVVTLYDNTSAGGTIIWSSGSMSNQTIPFSIDMKGLPFFNGLTLVIATANCNTLVVYE